LPRATQTYTGVCSILEQSLSIDEPFSSAFLHLCGGPPLRRTLGRVPLPKRLARFNLVVTNRVLGPAARRLPGFAVVHHVGRRSGRAFATPVNLFRHGDEYVIALTYGADSQWVRNVLAAGAVEVETRGRTIRLVDPHVVHDRSLVPAGVRRILRLVHVDEFMTLRRQRQP
jgi:deazaflavin-dependent oxidoreductase (nitroreductase family)